MPYTLGIDLGTTFTAAAVARDGRVETVPLGNHAATIPSMVFLRDDNEMLIGDAAERRGVHEPHRLARAFKRRFGDTTPVMLDRSPYSAERLMAVILGQIGRDVIQRQGEAPAATAITHPANWGPYKLDLLRQAAQISGLGAATFVSEPVAAAVQYASGERVDVGDVIAVYDLGGGTFDAAVLRKTPTGFELMGPPEGIERLGGIDFDEAVFTHVRDALGDQLETLDSDDPTVRAALSRLRQECVAAKETLSSDSDATVSVMLPSVQTQVRISRVEFEQMIRPTLRETVAATRRAIAAAGIQPEQVRSILLAGGSSRIPLIRELVAADLGRPIVTDAHPKQAVAMGAARLAAMSFGPGAARAAAPAPSGPATAQQRPSPRASSGRVPAPAPVDPRQIPAHAVAPGRDPFRPAAGPPSAHPRRGAALVAAGLVAAAVAVIAVIVLNKGDGRSSGTAGTGGPRTTAPDGAQATAPVRTQSSSPRTDPPARSTVPGRVTSPSSSATVPTTCAGGLCLSISSIELVSGAWIVKYGVSGFDPVIGAAPNLHVHFFYDTTPIDQAGVPGAGKWVVWDRAKGGGELVMNAMNVVNAPEMNGMGATAICAAIANHDHSIRTDTVVCSPLPA